MTPCQRIVSTAPIDRTAIDILEKICPVEIAPSADEQTMLGLLRNTIGLVCRGEGKITGRMINACPALRVIGRPGTGYDSVDTTAATAHCIPVVYAPVGGFAVAEGALALLLTIVKQIPLGDRLVKTGQWQKRYELKTGDLAGHTLGIIGLGRIGLRLAQLAQPFEIVILGYDTFVDANLARQAGVEKVELDELLKRSDFTSIHVPLNRETDRLLDRDRIALMKKGAVLINTARGGVVDGLDVLADALENGQLAAVGLDVFPTEPPDQTHRLFRHPGCICTPHVVGVSELAMQRIFESMATDMVAVLEGRRPKYCANPEVFER
jgi:D-3-phosphoglycerate dehydrogenase